MRKFRLALTIFNNKTWVKILMSMITFLYLLYILGYLLNGFCHYNFDLSSIWAGITAIGAGGFFQLGNYAIDSLYNSPAGKPPKEGGEEK